MNEWGSIKPLQFYQLKNLNIYEQIAGQILCMEHEYMKQLKKIPGNNRLFFRYEDICKNPNLLIKKVAHLLSEHYQAPKLTIENIAPFKVVKAIEQNYRREEIALFLRARENIMKFFPELLICEV